MKHCMLFLKICKMIAKDGEGATKLIEVEVKEQLQMRKRVKLLKRLWAHHLLKQQYLAVMQTGEELLRLSAIAGQRSIRSNND